MKKLSECVEALLDDLYNMGVDETTLAIASAKCGIGGLATKMLDDIKAAKAALAKEEP